MNDNTCNGWRNWQTWKINLHWGDYWASDIGLRSEPITAEEMRSDVEEFLDEAFSLLPEGQRLFIDDMIDLSVVDWYQLEDHYKEEA